MDSTTTAKLAREVRALVRLHNATDGNAIGLASINLDDLDRSWRDRVQRIRALPREAPRRVPMIEALRNLIEHTLARQIGDLDAIKASDAQLAAEALALAQRSATTSSDPSASS